MKKLTLSGATLVAAMTMGVATVNSTVHADSYQNLENTWKSVYPNINVDFVTAAKQGNGDAWRLTTQLDGHNPYGIGPLANRAKQANGDNGNAQGTTTNAQSSTVSNGQATVAAGSTTPSSTTANTQQPTYVATKSNSGMKTLPQTGNNNGEAMATTGLGLASLASMFGFGLLKHRFN